MEDENKKIYIGMDEEIPSIISKIHRHKESDVVLVVSYENEILQSLINLKIIKKKVEEMGKTVSVIKLDSQVKMEDKTKDKIEIKENIQTQENQKLIGSTRSIVDGKFNSDKLERKKTDVKNANVHLMATGPNVDNLSIQKDSEHKVKMFDIVRKVEEETSLNNLEESIETKTGIDSRIGKNEARYMSNNSGVGITSPRNKNKDLRKHKKETKKKILIPSINSKIFTLFILTVLTTAVLVICFILPKADISIVLKSEPVSYNFEFTTDETLDSIDFANNKIPLEKINIIGEQSEEYPTSGKKHLQEKASGEITVFNEYSSSPQRIVANTRFLSKESNKLFKVAKAVTIPGFSRVEGVDVPGQVKIIVYADKIGEDYNIGNSAFNLPGLQGSAKYSSVYARSIEPMSGGMDREVSYFSESDYLTAKEKLLKLAKEMNAVDFERKISKQSILLEETKKDEDIEIKTTIEIGDLAEKFEMKIIVKNSIATIDRGNLEKMIDEKIISKLGANKKLKGNSRVYDIRDISIDRDNHININVSVKQDVIENIEIEKLKSEIANKDEENLKSYFRNIDGVKSTDISLWPFWVKRVPSSYEKINVTIDIND